MTTPTLGPLPTPSPLTPFAPPTPAPEPPRSYVHQARGPRYRWWRPLVALVVATLGTTVAGLVVIAALYLVGLGAAVDSMDVLDPGAFLSGNLMIAALIPGTVLGLWAGFRINPGRVLSVTGGMRWGWLARCMALLAPVWAAYVTVGWLMTGAGMRERPEQWLGLLVVSVLTTPLQAAAEEIAFRGGLVQGVGAWFRSPVVALVVTTVASAAFFGLAHGSMDVWILVDLGFMAAAGCWLSWRTGGLEAIIALHVVNNLLVTTAGLLVGGLEESYIDTGVTSTPLDAGMSILATGVVTALLLRMARRQGVAPQGWTEPALG